MPHNLLCNCAIYLCLTIPLTLVNFILSARSYSPQLALMQLCSWNVCQEHSRKRSRDPGLHSSGDGNATRTVASRFPPPHLPLPPPNMTGTLCTAFLGLRRPSGDLRLSVPFFSGKLDVMFSALIRLLRPRESSHGPQKALKHHFQGFLFFCLKTRSDLLRPQNTL